ncbi:MAG: hypothetical protein IPK50_07830 [Fibrobacterota bacterium]|nr:MAG: hypothetical protein IPK50_07830 [Fibrobacterota bacterium]
MSLDLFCFFTHDASEAERGLTLLRDGSHKEIFRNLFIGKVAGVDEFFLEQILERYEMIPNSLVLIEISKTSSSEDDDRRVQIIKDVFGAQNSCILFDGEVHMRL